MDLLLNDIADCLNLPCFPPEVNHQILKFQTNAKRACPGDLYYIHPSPNWGPQNLVEAAANGSTALLVTDFKPHIKLPQLVVADSPCALRSIAKLWRDKHQIQIVAITGSCGKTTTKDITGKICTDHFGDEVLVTEGNLNGDYGLPSMVTRLRKEHKLAVLEVGTNKPGDMKRASLMLRPQTVVITCVAEVHLEALHNLQGVAEEKGQLIKHMLPNGTVILNRDCQFFHYFCGLAVQAKAKVVSFGHHVQSDVRIMRIICNRPLQVEILTSKQQFVAKSQLLGQHNAMNVAAATAVALELSVPAQCIQIAIEQVSNRKGRGCFVALSDRLHLIDDTYSANPASVKAAIDYLSTCETKRILIFGDMLELGEDNAISFHKEIGKYAKDKGIDHLLAVGSMSKYSVESFGNGALHFGCNEELSRKLFSLLLVSGKCTVVAKGSNKMKLGEVVEELRKRYTHIDID